MGIIDFTAVYQIVLFLVLWAVLDRVLFRPYLKLLDERERRTGGARTEIAELQTQAERLRAQYEEKIAVAEAEGRTTRETILAGAREQRDAIIGSAREQAARMLETVRGELASQMQKERQLALVEASNVARDMARKVLGRDVA
ncbi:MAG TPA: ATP synthase F0 subunit B [Candidatus Binatia bacterium]|jgi:F-type H+-transporting ATPase subunit b